MLVSVVSIDRGVVRKLMFASFGDYGYMNVVKGAPKSADLRVFQAVVGPTLFSLSLSREVSRVSLYAEDDT